MVADDPGDFLDETAGVLARSVRAAGPVASRDDVVDDHVENLAKSGFGDIRILRVRPLFHGGLPGFERRCWDRIRAYRSGVHGRRGQQMALFQKMALRISRCLHRRMMIVGRSVLSAAPSGQHRNPIGLCRYWIIAEAERFELKREVAVRQSMVSERVAHHAAKR